MNNKLEEVGIPTYSNSLDKFTIIFNYNLGINNQYYFIWKQLILGLKI